MFMSRDIVVCQCRLWPVAVLFLWASPTPLIERFCQGLAPVERVVWQDLLVYSTSLVALRRGVMMVAVGIVRECD